MSDKPISPVFGRSAMRRQRACFSAADRLSEKNTQDCRNFSLIKMERCSQNLETLELEKYFFTEFFLSENVFLRSKISYSSYYPLIEKYYDDSTMFLNRWTTQLSKSKIINYF